MNDKKRARKKSSPNGSTDHPISKKRVIKASKGKGHKRGQKSPQASQASYKKHDVVFSIKSGLDLLNTSLDVSFDSQSEDLQETESKVRKQELDIEELVNCQRQKKGNHNRYSLLNMDDQNIMEVTDPVAEPGNGDIKMLLAQLQAGQKAIQDSIAKQSTEFKQKIEALEHKIETKVTEAVKRLEDKTDKQIDDLRVQIGRLRTENDLLKSQVNMSAKEPTNIDEVTMIADGLVENAMEDIMQKSQKLIDAIAPNIKVVQAKRLVSRNPRKPGLVKIAVESRGHKAQVMKEKSKLKSIPEYKDVMLRNSKSFGERIAEQNTMFFLDQWEFGHRYRLAANGKVVPRDAPSRSQYQRNNGPHQGIQGQGQHNMQTQPAQMTNAFSYSVPPDRSNTGYTQAMQHNAQGPQSQLRPQYTEANYPPMMQRPHIRGATPHVYQAVAGSSGQGYSGSTTRVHQGPTAGAQPSTNGVNINSQQQMLPGAGNG